MLALSKSAATVGRLQFNCRVYRQSTLLSEAYGAANLAMSMWLKTMYPLRQGSKSHEADQYSDPNMTVSTRCVTVGSAGSGECMHRSRS